MSGLSFPLSAIKQGNLPGILLAGWGQITHDLITSMTSWGDGKVLVVRFTPSVASGDVQVFGPLYIRAGYLVANDGTNEATIATAWVAADTVTALIETDERGYMRIGRMK